MKACTKSFPKEGKKNHVLEYTNFIYWAERSVVDNQSFGSGESPLWLVDGDDDNPK